MVNPKYDAFLKALSELSIKHGVVIVNTGCGCCGPVALIDTTAKEGHYVCSSGYDDPYFKEIK